MAPLLVAGRPADDVECPGETTDLLGDRGGIGKAELTGSGGASVSEGEVDERLKRLAIRLDERGWVDVDPRAVSGDPACQEIVGVRLLAKQVENARGRGQRRLAGYLLDPN